MMTRENLTPEDPQAELRAQYIKAMRAYERRRAALLANGVNELDIFKYLRFDFASFNELRCGAKGKRTGKPCPHTGIYANSRCQWHGGLSTGPKTPEGKARAALNGGAPKRSP